MIEQVVQTSHLIVNPAAIAAAGSSSADAAPLQGWSATVSGADGSAGVRLRPEANGSVATVYNEHATAGLKVYPHVGGTINGGSTDAAIVIEGKSLAIFHRVSETNWGAIFTPNT